MGGRQEQRWWQDEARPEASPFLKRRRRVWSNVGRFLIVVSAALGLVLHLTALAAWVDSATTIARVAWAVVRDDNFDVTRSLGLRAFLEDDGGSERVIPWDACEATYDAKVDAAEAAAATAAPQRKVVLGLDDERDECALCAANVDAVFTLALAALPFALMAFYCSWVRWARGRETRTLRFLSISASLGTMIFLACSVLRFHASCGSAAALVVDRGGAWSVGSADSDWGAGMYCAAIAIALRALDIVIFSIRPLSARKIVPYDGEFASPFLASGAPPPPPPPPASPSASPSSGWSPTTNALRAATYQSLPFSRD